MVFQTGARTAERHRMRNVPGYHHHKTAIRSGDAIVDRCHLSVDDLWMSNELSLSTKGHFTFPNRRGYGLHLEREETKGKPRVKKRIGIIGVTRSRAAGEGNHAGNGRNRVGDAPNVIRSATIEMGTWNETGTTT